MSESFSPSQWIALLQSERPPLQLLKKGPLPLQEEYAQHESLYQKDPSLYALSVLSDGVTQGQALRVLYHLLAHSRAGLSAEARGIVSTITARLLKILPEDELLTMFLVLRRGRVNHKHTSRAILDSLLNHAPLRALWKTRRRAVAEALEHALGGQVFRGCRDAILAEKPTEEMGTYLKKHLLSYTNTDERQVRSWVKKLLQPEKAQEPEKLTMKKRAERLALPAFTFTEEVERPRTINATNRGDISATLVHMYRGGSTSELTDALKTFVERAATKSPAFAGKLALIVDASTSTRGYGEREFCCISQSIAFKLVLEKICSQLELWVVGGHNDPPVPQGESDLATALLDALEGDPDLTVIVSDGYENAEYGDLSRVLAALPRVGVKTPVIFCQSKFTSKDSLDLRRPLRGSIEASFWHEDDFPALCATLFSMARGESGEAFLKSVLMKRYETVQLRHSDEGRHPER